MKTPPWKEPCPCGCRSLPTHRPTHKDEYAYHLETKMSAATDRIKALEACVNAESLTVGELKVRLDSIRRALAF